ncbi:MAG: SIS domain-containing protein [Nocardioides sp.]
MATWFDESRLDDESVLARGDAVLRSLAESGARVRREFADADPLRAASFDGNRPRAVAAVGPDSRLLRAVLEPWCPVPFVAWPGPGLPGWAGSLDLVVALAPDGADRGTAAAVAEAVRRGSQTVVACPPASSVADHAVGRWATVLPTSTHDQLAAAVVVLEYLHQLGLGPAADHDEVATALDDVAIASSPQRDLAVNPAKMLAIALADSQPVVWGGSVLAARAARRVAEAIRRSTGQSALAGDAEHLIPVLEAVVPRDVFVDPFADGPIAAARPVLLVLDDGSDDPMVREQRGLLRAAADSRGVRVETVTTGASAEVARYASLMLSGRYAAEYVRLGQVDD